MAIVITGFFFKTMTGFNDGDISTTCIRYKQVIKVKQIINARYNESTTYKTNQKKFPTSALYVSRPFPR